MSATVSCPGATATEFATSAGTDKSMLFRMGTMTSAEVALGGYRAMLAGKRIVVHGLKNKLAALSVSFSPNLVLLAIAARLNKDPDAAKQMKA